VSFVAQLCRMHTKGLFTARELICVQNSPSTDRPSFAAINQVVTITRVNNERAYNWVDLLQDISSRQFSLCPVKKPLVIGAL